MLSCQLLKAEIQLKLGKYDQALNFLNAIIDNGSKFKNQLIVIDALILKAKLHWTTGEGKKSSSCVSECRELIKTLKKGEEKSLREARLLIQQGINSWTNSNHKEALESYQLSYKIGMDIQSTECIAESLGNIGTVHILKGNFSEALTATKESLNLLKEIGDRVSLADASTNLGHIYWRQGELDQALEHIEVGLEIFREIGEKIRIAASYSNIGMIYFAQNENEKALNTLLAAKEYYEQIGNDFYLSRVIFHMVRVALGSNQLEKAQKYFEELQTIIQDDSSKSMVHQLKMAEALILKNTKRITNLAKSESLLREIINDSIVLHEITTMALEHLCEIRLVELRTTSGDPLILEEIQGFVNKLLEIANQQNISPLLVQTYVLQSKMALLQNNGKFAKKLLIQAQDLAEKKGLQKLAISVSNEYDSLLSKINKKKPIFSNNPTTIIERVESVKFEETLTQMIDHKEVKIPPKLEESPILLLIIHESGLGVYSKEFSMKSFKEQLISGIITAINALLQDVFEVGGTIERIRYKDFRLVIKGVTPLLFVYVFKGHSYLPIKKLEKFIEDLEDTTIWEVFCNISKKGTLLSDTDNQVIDDFIRKDFLEGSN